MSCQARGLRRIILSKRKVDHYTMSRCNVQQPACRATCLSHEIYDLITTVSHNLQTNLSPG